MNITSFTTSVFILGTIAVIFAYDTLAAAFGRHATISETTSFKISKSRVFTFFLALGLGVLVGHLLFSVNFCN